MTNVQSVYLFAKSNSILSIVSNGQQQHQPVGHTQNTDPSPFTTNPFLDVIDFSFPGDSGAAEGRSLSSPVIRQPEVISVNVFPEIGTVGTGSNGAITPFNNDFFVPDDDVIDVADNGGFVTNNNDIFGPPATNIIGFNSPPPPPLSETFRNTGPARNLPLTDNGPAAAASAGAREADFCSTYTT